jgi:hypothetical protein
VLSASTLTVNNAFALSGADFTIDSVSMTASAAELNVLDGVVGGTASADKAVVLDSNLDVGGIRRVVLNNTVADADALTVLDGNVTISAGDLVLSQGNLTVNSKLLVGPGSAITSQTDEMRFEDSLLQLNYSSGKSLSDNALSGRHGGVWLRNDSETSGTATGLFADESADWYLTKEHADPNANFMANLSTLSRADLYVGTVSGSIASSGVTRTVETFATSGETLDATHHIVFIDGDMEGGAEINLPAAGDHTGREYKIKNTGLNNVTINAQSGEQVNGNSSDSVYSDGKTYISNGTAWFSI